MTYDQPLYTLSGKADPKELAYKLWRRSIHSDVWWPTHRNSVSQSSWQTSRGHWLDRSSRLGPGLLPVEQQIRFWKYPHVTRTRRAHQVTASSLYLLHQSAYKEYIQALDDSSNAVPFEDWCDAGSDACPQFQFWYLILQLELAVMIYVRSIREADFLLYIEALFKIFSWFFALDHAHYSRWVPIHLRDRVSL